MDNYIITSFSLINNVSEFDSKTDEFEEWFKFRASIFNTFTLPSVLDNSIKPKGLILLFNKDHFYFYDLYIKKNELIFPIFTNVSEFRDDIFNFISKKDFSDLVLTRLDSDDYISNNFLSETNKSIENNLFLENVYYIVVNGFITNLQIVNQVRYVTSPFISVYGKQANILYNLYNHAHTEIPREKRIYVEKSFWVQLIHGTNRANALMTNQTIYNIKQFIKFILNRFIGKEKYPVERTFLNSFVLGEEFSDFISSSCLTALKVVISEYNGYLDIGKLR